VLTERNLLSEEDAASIFDAKNLIALGYDEALYEGIRRRSAGRLTAYAASLASHERATETGKAVI
jgi:hypothetical protein